MGTQLKKFQIVFTFWQCNDTTYREGGKVLPRQPQKKNRGETEMTLKPDPAHDTTGNGLESHYDLARQLEMRGYELRMDSEDNEHSEVWFENQHVGDIYGDNPATVTTISDERTVEDIGDGFYEAADGTVIYSPEA